MVHRAHDSLHAGLVFLRDRYRLNGYNDQQIHSALNSLLSLSLPDKKPDSAVFLLMSG
jgi:hypothetical protein